ncbi:MAG: FHA domain-containing protein, partial [Nannocystaceae bacterium]
SSPRPETAAILAPPEGWPDITDDLAEVRFSAIQGFDEDTRRAISDLRARFPGHPEVDILAEELGEATRSGPSPFPAEGSGPTPVEGPPPLGRFPVGTPGADELEVSLDSDESASASVPVITGNTLPPPSASSEPTSLEDDEPEGLELPANLISRSSGGRSSTGAPEPTPAVTSDELLDLDVLEFDSLVEDRSVSSGPTLLDELDLDVQEPGAVDGAVTGDVSGSTEPSPAAARAGAQPEDGVVVAEEPAVVESAPTPPTSVAGESLHDISFDFDDDHDDADGFIDEGRDRADRTMMVRGYQPPAPYGGGSEPEPIEPSSSEAVEPEPEPEPEAVEVEVEVEPEAVEVEVEVESSFEPEPPIDPELIVEDERSPTLTPLGEYDSRSPDELETTLPPGNFTVGRRLRSTLAPDLDAVPSSVEASPTPMPQSSGSWSSTTVAPDGSPSPEDSGELYSPSGMTAPDRDSDSAAASGEFRVSDLGLDDLPDLEASSSSMPPLSPAEPPIEGGGGTRVSPAPGPDGQTTSDGTVIARAPLPPMPYGAGRAPVPVTPVRLVMLGARGEPVAERRIEPGSSLDIGRMPGEPWASDRRMEPLHARLFPAPGGLVVDDFGAPQGVYTQISDTIAIEDGDEFKVGQARLALQRVIGPDGVWGQLTLVRHDDPSPSTYRLDRNEILVGREDGDITLPNDTFVSGDHCRFSREGNAVYLEDLGSSNGTYIRVRAGQCVAFGGLLLIGHTQFRVYAD